MKCKNREISIDEYCDINIINAVQRLLSKVHFIKHIYFYRAALDDIVYWLNNSEYMTSFAVSHNTSGRVTIDVYGNLRITNAKSYDGGLLECWIRMKKTRAVQFIGIAAQYYNLSVALCLLFKILSRIFTSSSPAYKETLDRTMNRTKTLS